MISIDNIRRYYIMRYMLVYGIGRTEMADRFRMSPRILNEFIDFKKPMLRYHANRVDAFLSHLPNYDIPPNKRQRLNKLE